MLGAALGIAGLGPIFFPTLFFGLIHGKIAGLPVGFLDFSQFCGILLT